MKPVLLVEDNPVDAELVVRTFIKVGFVVPVIVCETGDEAIDYLNDALGSYNQPLPQMIFLDLNLPGMDGREVLQEIRSMDKLRSIPITVLSTSDDAYDIRDCYERGANSFMTKPDNPADYVVKLEQFKRYWFETATLPIPVAN